MCLVLLFCGLTKMGFDAFTRGPTMFEAFTRDVDSVAGDSEEEDPLFGLSAAFLAEHHATSLRETSCSKIVSY